MARRGAPALYELLNRGRDAQGGKPAGGVSVPNNAPGRRQGASSLGPKPGASHSVSPSPSVSAASGYSGGAAGADTGRRAMDPALVRLAGLCAVGLAVLVGVYSLGVARGRASTQGEDAVPVGASNGEDAATGPVSVDSSRAAGGSPDGSAAAGEKTPPVAPPSKAQARSEPRSENQARPSERAVEGAVGPALAPAQRGLDPRQAGLQYVVIASVLESNADKLVQFCRERGLDAWVVPDQNGRLREITVLPGIPKSELKGTVASELKSRIRKVGAQWKAAGRGNSDFEDHYFKPFNG